MAQKDFFKKLKDAEGAWEEGRKGRSGGFIEVETGFKGIVRGQSMELDATEKGVPFVHITTIVVNAEDDSDLGARVATRINIQHLSGTYQADTGKNKKGDKWEITEAQCFSQVAEALQALGFETEGLAVSDLPQAAEQLADEQSACRVEIGENKKGYKYVKWGKPVDDDDLMSIDDVLDDDDDVDDDPADDADDDVADDDDQIDPPEKGETLPARPKGARKVEEYNVISVNKSKETCTLQRVRDDRKFTNQSWDVLA
jgi:hypothetical protein